MFLTQVNLLVIDERRFLSKRDEAFLAPACTCRVCHLCEFAGVELDYVFENKHKSIHNTCKVFPLCEFADVQLDKFFENKHMSTVHNLKDFSLICILLCCKNRDL